MEMKANRWVFLSILGLMLLTSACAAPRTPYRPSAPQQQTQATTTTTQIPPPIVEQSGPIETCFSPKENCDQKLIALIDNAKSTLDIAIYSITHKDITAAIKSAKSRGVTVRMIVDRVQSKGKSSQVDDLLAFGINLKIGKFSGIMHDKFTIADGQTLETGSYNYSDNATTRNAENQVYINDKKVVQSFTENFDSMFSDANNY